MGSVTSPPSNVSARDNTSMETATKLLLACGIVSGLLFNIVAWIEMLTRSGFDIRKHAISLLSLGSLGWIQIANFILTGVLAILCAIGLRMVMRRGVGATWAPILIGVYGIGLIAAGLFHPDPGNGFPAGAPAGLPSTMSWHAGLHSLAFFVLFISLIAASFVMARRFKSLGQRGWRMYCIGTGLTCPLLIVLGLVIPGGAGICFAIAAAIGFGWVSVVAGKLLTES